MLLPLVQGLKFYCQMKKLIQKSNENKSAFSNFQTLALSKAQQLQIKGGSEDGIIIDEIIET